MTNSIVPRIPKNLWIDNILVGVEPLSDPMQEFSKYQWNNLYQYYSNFLDYICESLYEDAFLEILIQSCVRKFDFYQITIEKLETLHLLVEPFYKACSRLTDFEIIRRPEWDIIAPLGKECVRLFEQEKKKENTDQVLTDKDMEQST